MLLKGDYFNNSSSTRSFMKKLSFFFFLLLTLSLSLLRAQTEDTSSTSNQLTTTASEYCQFLNTYAVDDSFSSSSSYYTTEVATSIFRHKSGPKSHYYYTLIEGHDNDTIEVSQQIETEFQQWESTKQDSPAVALLCLYLNDKVNSLGTWNHLFHGDDEKDIATIRQLYPDTTSQQLFDKMDKIASIVFNWSFLGPTSDHHYYGPSVDFSNHCVNNEFDSLSITSSHAYIMSGNTKIIGFLESDGSSAIAHAEKNQGFTYPSSDISIEYRSLASQGDVQSFTTPIQ